MHAGKLVFAQLMEHLPSHTFRGSLRDIETCLRTHSTKLYHRGIRGGVAPSALADANEKRGWRIYSHPVDKATGLRCNQTIVPTGVKTATDYPFQLRRVKFYDARTQQTVRLSHQQLRASRPYHRPALPLSLANRTVLQVDQSAYADQGVLRDLRECRQDPGLDRHWVRLFCNDGEQWGNSGLARR